MTTPEDAPVPQFNWTPENMAEIRRRWLLVVGPAALIQPRRRVRDEFFFSVGHGRGERSSPGDDVGHWSDSPRSSKAFLGVGLGHLPRVDPIKGIEIFVADVSK